MKYLLIATVLLSACSSCSTQVKPALTVAPTPTIEPTAPPAVWHVNANGFRLTLDLARLDDVTWDGNQLEFRRALQGVTQWYKVTVEDGVMVGRFSHSTEPAKPDLSAYKYHVTGWDRDAFPITPVVFDINANGYQGRLGIDKAGGVFTGRLKFYATNGALNESLEEEVLVTHWDGAAINFIRPFANQTYTGQANGAEISGTFTYAGAPYSWSGRRAEMLTYGMAPKTAEQRQAWQERTRRTLHRLMMAGNPAPLSVTVEILGDNIPPIAGNLYPLRDDDPGSHPQNYTLTELKLTYTLPNWLGGAPITRTVHAYLAKPTTPPPGGLEKYPLLLSVNGHGGSAYQTMDGGTLFYYGDAFARRGYMVLAVDISHRPISDRFGYTEWVENGDDPEHGNGSHPSIKPIPDKYYTDWEEDGERVWDVMRGLDYALSRSDVDHGKIAVTGLSMGGEVASYVGALDPRIAVTIPAGYSPDMNVVKYHGNHGCWTWAWADVREYIDQSDILSLIAPRGLIVQTGKEDRVFSNIGFAGDKQVMRRARVAGGPVVHFLHPLIHEWRAGQVRQPTMIEPSSPGDLPWQTNGETTSDGQTLFDHVRQFLNF